MVTYHVIEQELAGEIVHTERSTNGNFEPGDNIVPKKWERFSEAEMSRRRESILDEAKSQLCDLIIAYGADRSGSSVEWLCSWPVTREAVLLIDGNSNEDLLLVQFHNHVPQAIELADRCEVRWAGPSTADTLIGELKRRGTSSRNIGVIGPLPFGLYRQIAETARGTSALDPQYLRLRLIKSEEEIERVSIGAQFTDLAVLALKDNLQDGLLDHQLSDIVERAYVPLGGTTHIHYFGITAMDEPHRGAPVQHTVGRRVQEGDVIVTEISAAYQGYPGQALRTMTMSEELSPLYRDLHAVADATYDAVFETLRPGTTPDEIVAAATIIENSGFTTLDDLVHGFVGGYLPPVLGSRSRPASKLPDLELAPGMTLVIQPNVTTLDHSAGVQTGQLVLITDTGAKSLHQLPRGPWEGIGKS